MSTYIHENRTPNGNPFKLECRLDTNDQDVAHSVSKRDEYRLRGLELDGWALDIGAYIGGVAIPLAIDHPDLQVIAVEPVPENAELLRSNIDLNGLAERVYVAAVAAVGPEQAATLDVVYGFDGVRHRYVGNLQQEGGTVTVNVPALTLSQMLRDHADIALCKIDCEGCEWDFLSDPAVSRIDRIVGEVHPSDTTGDGSFIGLSLLRTHDVVMHDEFHFTAVRHRR